MDTKNLHPVHRPSPFRKAGRNLWRVMQGGLAILTMLASLLAPPGLVARADRAVCATPGKDGPVTISAANTIVNTYYPGTGTVAAGATSIPVNNANRQGAAAQVEAGDLLLVIQMQGAEIDDTQSLAYGDSVAGAPASGNLNNANFTAGRYEYVVATSGAVTGTITISSPLLYSYTTAAATTTQGERSFQVIRVPQYSNLTINNGASITAYSWNSTPAGVIYKVGGVVVFDVAGTLSLGGGAVISVTGQGFRAGGGRTIGGSATGGYYDTDVRTSSSVVNQNGSKGEGIAGTPRYLYVSGTTVIDRGIANEGYPRGAMGRGAPGNAGGGGTDGNPNNNDQNTGGGGGGNGGAGGQGGYAWSSIDNSGGFGGATFTALSPARLVMGGGGGAGSINNATAYQSSGGAGGGIVMVRAGAVTGTGTVNANGNDAPGQPQNDAAGGGGAGGSVVILARNGTLPSGLNVNANGGRGGDAWATSAPGTPSELTPGSANLRHGPGGGGGGGAIYLSSTAGTLSVAGGAHGVTTTANSAFGSQAGSPGVSGTSTTPADLPGDIAGATCLPNAGVVKTTSTPVVTQTPSGTTGTYTITISNPASSGGMIGVTISDTLPAGFTYTSTGSVNLSGGATRPSTTNPTPGSGTPAWGVFTIPSGGSVAITFTVNIAAGTTGLFQNPAAITYSDPLRTTPGGTDNQAYDPASSTQEDILVLPAPNNLPLASNDVYSIPMNSPAQVFAILANDNFGLDGPSTSGPVFITVGPANGVASVNTQGTGTQADDTISYTPNPGFFGIDTLTYRICDATVPPDCTTATVTIYILAPPTMSKAFSPNPLGRDQAATLTFTLTNPNDFAALTGVAFTDPLPNAPAQMVVAGPPNASTSNCGTPTFAPLAGATSLTFSGGMIHASGTCTVSVDVTAPAAGTYNNTSSAVTSTNGGTGNQASAPVTFLDPPVISKTFPVATIPTNTGVTLTFTITNPNPGSAIHGVSFSDAFPAGMTVASPTGASASAGCGAPTFNPVAGSGSITFSGGTIPAGGTCTLTVNVAAPAMGTYTNVSGNVSSTDTGTGNSASASVRAVESLYNFRKAFSTSPVNVGTAVTLTFTLENRNLYDALTGVAFTDAFPAGMVVAPAPAASTTCSPGTITATPGAGSIAFSGGTVNAGQICTVQVNVVSSVAGSHNNVSSVVTSTNGGDGGTASATLVVNGNVDLGVTKTDGVTTYAPGAPITYSVVVTNSGPGGVSGAIVTDTIPADIQNPTWTCLAEPGASCTASGSGNINDTVTIPVGRKVTYTISGIISAGATGPLVNTITAAAPAGATDTNPANNSATDIDAPRVCTSGVFAAWNFTGSVITPSQGYGLLTTAGLTGPTWPASQPPATNDPAISHTNWGTGALVQGTDYIQFTISTAGRGSIRMDFIDYRSATGPANFAIFYSTDGTNFTQLGGAYAVAATTWASRSIDFSSVPAINDRNLVYIRLYGYNAGSTAGTWRQDNVTFSGDCLADLGVTKTDGATEYTPGATTTYTINVTNAGPVDVTNATVSDTRPAGITSWTWSCLAAGGATCTAGPVSPVNFTDTVNLPVGGSLTYTVVADISPAATGSLVNTATVTLPPGATDPDNSNNSATDTDDVASVADLTITKTDNIAAVSPGEAVTYLIVVSNSGPSNVTGATVTDAFPAELTGVTWTCAGAGGATCTASGSGSINDASVNIPAGASVTYTVQATVALSATADVVNTATVTPPAGVTDPTLPNTATDTDLLQLNGVIVVDKVTVPGGSLQSFQFTTGGAGYTGFSLTDAATPNSQSLAPGTYSVSEIVPAGWNLTNVACVSSIGDTETAASIELDAAETVTCTFTNTAILGLDATKTADAASIPETGQAVTYTVTVENTSPVAVTLDSLVDDLFHDITITGHDGITNTTCASGGTIAIGGAYSCTFTAIVAGDYPGSHVNTITAQVSSGSLTASDAASASVDFTDVLPDIAVTKTANPASVPETGSSVTFTYTITNNSLEAATITALNDDRFGALTGDADCQVGTILAGGASCSFDATFAVPAGDYPGSHVNTFTASASDDDGNTDTATANASVAYTDVLPSGTVSKLPVPASVPETGGSVTFAVTVTNASTEAATLNLLLDDVYGDLNGQGTCSVPQLLAANGGTYSCTFSAFLVGDASSPSHSNTVTAFLYDDDGNFITPADTAVVSFADVLPDISVAKTANPTTVLATGGDVTYTIVVTNNTAEPVSLTTLIDDQFGNLDGQGTCSLTQAIAGNGTYTCQFTASLPPAPAGSTHVNTVTAQAFDNEGNSDTAADSVSVDYQGTASLALSKTGALDMTVVLPADRADAGDVIHYTILVTNTGNLPLTGVTITDTGTGVTLGTCSPAMPASLAPDARLTCAASHTVTQADLDAGSFSNTAFGDSDQTPPTSDTEVVAFTQNPLIGIAKDAVSISKVSTGTYDITFDVLVRNYGNVSLHNVQVTDNLSAAFPLPTTFTVSSISSPTLNVNPLYDGNSNTNMLIGSDALAVGAEGRITVVVRVIPANAGPFENTAIASGLSPSDTPVADESQDGTNPDPDQDGDPTNDDRPTFVMFGPLFDPPFGVKVVDANGLPMLRWTIMWINNANLVAVHAESSDPIPEGTVYVAAGAPSGYPVPVTAPPGSTNVGVSCADSSVITETSLCYYEGPTIAFPRGRIIWAGVIGPDLGAMSAEAAVNEIAISFAVQVNTGVQQVYNQATINSDLNGDGDANDPNEQNVASAAAAWSGGTDMPPTLPETGFAPGKMTNLPVQPANATYQALTSLRLEVPKLGVRTTILGVPVADSRWNVSWLGNRAGWLNGTAYPAASGNSVITGHVYLANGQPGPFVNLGSLKWGDEVIIRLNGQQYVYEVRAVTRVKPDDLSVLRHEERAWVTLVTCQGYNEASNTYAYRLAVRAVLVRVQPDYSDQAGIR